MGFSSGRRLVSSISSSNSSSEMRVGVLKLCLSRLLFSARWKMRWLSYVNLSVRAPSLCWRRSSSWYGVSFVLAMQGQDLLLLAFVASLVILSLEWKTVLDSGFRLKSLWVLLAWAWKVCLRSTGVSLGGLLVLSVWKKKIAISNIDWLPDIKNGDEWTSKMESIAISNVH